MKILENNGVVKNTLTLVFGAISSQLITMLSMPIVTRLYSVESFGTTGFIFSIVNIAVPLATMGYYLAIILPEDNIDALLIRRFSKYISLIIAALIFFYLIGYTNYFPKNDLFSLGGANDSLFLIPVIVIAISWSQIDQYWLIRNNEFTTIVQSNIISSILSNGSKIIFGFISPSANALIISNTSNPILQVLFYNLLSKSKVIVSRKSLNKTKKLIIEYKKFAFLRTPQNLISIASESLPIIMLTYFYDVSYSGLYLLARTAIGMPSTMIGDAINKVYYKRLNEKKYLNEDLFESIKNTTIFLFLVGLIPFGIMFFLSPVVFPIIFGADWNLSGEYAQWLSVLFFFNFINKPSVASVPIFDLEKGLLIYQIISTLTQLVALYFILYFTENDVLAIAGFSLMGSLNYIFLIAWIFMEIKCKSK